LDQTGFLLQVFEKSQNVFFRNISGTLKPGSSLPEYQHRMGCKTSPVNNKASWSVQDSDSH